MNFSIVVPLIALCFLGCAYTKSREINFDIKSTKNCSDFLTCNDCTSSWSCNWCETEKECQNGEFYGPKGSCTGWRWKQCKLQGLTFLILVGAGAGLGLILIIVIICCCCCKCCCKKKRDDGYQMLSIQDEESVPYVERPLNTSRSDERRRELHAKYNLK